MRIGELAKRTGVSVRTLHHYDEIGLLSPSTRTDAGHRLYTEDDVALLSGIRSLQALGFSLDEIRVFHARPDASVGRALGMLLHRAQQSLASQQRLCRRLEDVARLLDDRGEVSMDDLLNTIEDIAMFEKYYTEEQMKELARRRDVVGEDRIRAVEGEWQDLFQQFREAMASGTDPSDPAVQALVRKQTELVAEFTGGDRGILESLGNLWANEPGMRERVGVEPDLSSYMRRAAECGRDA